MNEKQIRDIAADLRKQASVLEDSLPAPDMNRVDYEPAYELGTRHIEYVNGIRCVHRYVKVDAGVVGHSEDGQELRFDYHRWI
jgi:hypothetical protein